MVWLEIIRAEHKAGLKYLHENSFLKSAKLESSSLINDKNVNQVAFSLINQVKCLKRAV